MSPRRVRVSSLVVLFSLCLRLCLCCVVRCERERVPKTMLSVYYSVLPGQHTSAAVSWMGSCTVCLETDFVFVQFER